MKLDLGCGKRKQADHHGVDKIAFDGVDTVLDMGRDPWPWETDSIDGAYCCHAIEHLDWPGRVYFFNELWRVMKSGAQATLIWPNWSHECYWGDPTHGPPISPFALMYLNPEWREANAPHCGYVCSFDATWGYALDNIVGRNTEWVQFGAKHYINIVRDIHATLTAKK